MENYYRLLIFHSIRGPLNSLCKNYYKKIQEQLWKEYSILKMH
nr:MAG TPA: hypothetical protein [Caudoviricetes sp.]